MWLGGGGLLQCAHGAQRGRQLAQHGRQLRQHGRHLAQRAQQRRQLARGVPLCERAAVPRSVPAPGRRRRQRQPRATVRRPLRRAASPPHTPLRIPAPWRSAAAAVARRLVATPHARARRLLLRMPALPGARPVPPAALRRRRQRRRLPLHGLQVADAPHERLHLRARQHHPIAIAAPGCLPRLPPAACSFVPIPVAAVICMAAPSPGAAGPVPACSDGAAGMCRREVPPRPGVVRVPARFAVAVAGSITGAQPVVLGSQVRCTQRSL